MVGAAVRRDGYMEGNGWLVSWCRGHLVEPNAPDLYDSRYSKWNINDLPIIPTEWQFHVPPGCKKQYTILPQELRQQRSIGNKL